MNSITTEKIMWASAGTVLVLLVAFLLGGVYTITPPSGARRHRLQNESLHWQSMAD